MESTQECCIQGCGKPIWIKKHRLCMAHYARLQRYGAPTAKPPSRRKNLAGARFGRIVVVAEERPNYWLCRCDCGHEWIVRAWCLTSGTTTRCGSTLECRIADRPLTSYAGAHQRVRSARGTANGYDCIDCQATAAHWSYVGDCPSEQVDDKGRAYSPNPSMYVPRCIPCHWRVDGKTGPRK